MEGKAKEAFEKWLISDIDENDNRSGTQVYVRLTIFENYKQNLKNTLIIEWLDSVGIYINIENLYYQSWWSFKVKSCPNTYTEVFMTATRAEATNKAIEKAVDIYNSLNK